MNQKYIRTYYDNEKVIIRMIGCHQCPLMKFDEQLFMCECRYFATPMGRVVKDFVSVYSKETKRIMEQIEIPNWCSLPSTYTAMQMNNDIYSLVNHGIRVNCKETDKNVKLVDACEGNYDLIRITNYRDTNIPIERVDTRYVYDEHTNPLFDDYRISYSKPIVIPPASKNQNCSLCGEEDESVDRNEHFGMCDDCQELSMDDPYKLNQAYINNFRLKRNVKIESNIQFKQLKEINT